MAQKTLRQEIVGGILDQRPVVGRYENPMVGYTWGRLDEDNAQYGSAQDLLELVIRFWGFNAL
jgi:hypothetical protein